jgi:TusE/DsrC/DsvC family sulfur relay protein
VDGLFIGGGFPEMFLPELQANATLRRDIQAQISAGLPTYAECGGLMYLARSIRWKDGVYDMVGALGADVVMFDRPVGRGYVVLQATGDAPWSPVDTENADAKLRGHEFHYSSLENLAPDQKFAYKVLRGHGADGRHDGLVQHNALASYAHLRSAAGANWARGFVDFVRARREQSLATHPAEALRVKGREVATDAEGYLKNLDDWSEDFAVAQAQKEQLQLTEAHWQVIHFLRAYYEEHRAQAQVRAMIWHFAKAWGQERGNNHYLHDLFPVGGPQKQGNRLAGLWKTKGEH